MKAMLDTNTCIYAMQRARGFAPRLPLRDCGISVVVLGELEWGVQRSARVAENREALEHWLTAIQVVEMDIDVARRYGRIRADLTAAGQPIGPNDRHRPQLGGHPRSPRRRRRHPPYHRRHPPGPPHHLRNRVPSLLRPLQPGTRLQDGLGQTPTPTQSMNLSFG